MIKKASFSNTEYDAFVFGKVVKDGDRTLLRMSCAHPAEVEALLFQFFYVRFLYTINFIFQYGE
jgi:hypothetical protein